MIFQRYITMVIRRVLPDRLEGCMASFRQRTQIWFAFVMKASSYDKRRETLMFRKQLQCYEIAILYCHSRITDCLREGTILQPRRQRPSHVQHRSSALPLVILPIRELHRRTNPLAFLLIKKELQRGQVACSTQLERSCSQTFHCGSLIIAFRLSMQESVSCDLSRIKNPLMALFQ